MSLLKQYREERNYSLYKAGKLIGVHPNTLQRWESGETLPNTQQLSKIREAYGLTGDELLELIPQQQGGAA